MTDHRNRWTDDEWRGFCLLLQSWWPGDFNDDDRYAWRIALADVPPADAVQAARRLLAQGGRFRPSAGEFLAAATAPTELRPTPEAAWALVEAAVCLVGCSVHHADFDRRHQHAVDWLAGHDEVLGAWAASRALCGPGSLGHEPVHDPEHGGAVRHRLTRDLAGAYAAARERELRGLPPVRAGALTVRATGQHGGGMRELVERLRPARHLAAVSEPEDAA